MPYIAMRGDKAACVAALPWVRVIGMTRRNFGAVLMRRDRAEEAKPAIAFGDAGFRVESWLPDLDSNQGHSD